MSKRSKPAHSLDIDIRFLLANERTLLAWIRTALALIGGGIAVTFVANDSHYGAIAGLGAVAFGALMALIGYVRYQAADAAIRAGKLPPTGAAGILVVAAVVIFALVLIVARELQLL